MVLLLIVDIWLGCCPGHYRRANEWHRTMHADSILIYDAWLTIRNDDGDACGADSVRPSLLHA